MATSSRWDYLYHLIKPGLPQNNFLKAMANCRQASFGSTHGICRRMFSLIRDTARLLAGGWQLHLEAYGRNSRSQIQIRETYSVRVIIVPDRSAPKGYRVDTAFPRTPK